VFYKKDKKDLNIPGNNTIRLGKFLGIIFYLLDFRHRNIVRRNLQFAYADWSKSKIRRMSRLIFKNIGITFVEIFQMYFISKDEIIKRVQVRGEDFLHEAIKSSKGVILISAHIGNWEMAHTFISSYFNMPITLVVRELESSILDRWINKLRSRFGNKVIYKKGALSSLARTLRGGGTIGLLIDQETKMSEGIRIKFFNKTANATPAAAMLARRYECPVIPVFCVHDESSKNLTLIVEPPLSLVKTKDIQYDIMQNTQIMTDYIEKIVREKPEQWFWFHKRWKRHYPELYRR
jgi:KDO2-lipid IV(A) lauroyltransferase